MDQASLVTQFELLLPRAVAWASDQEQQILRVGVPLFLKVKADCLKQAQHHPCVASKHEKDAGTEQRLGDSITT